MVSMERQLFLRMSLVTVTSLNLSNNLQVSWLQWTLDDLKFSLTSRIFRATVSFLSAQLQHKMFVKSEPLPLYIYLLSGDQFKIQTSFVLFLATRYHQFLFKIFVRNHFSTELTNLICSFDAGETHTHSVVLVGMEPILSAIQLPNVIWPVTGHATPHFCYETQMKPFQRDK